MPSAARRSPARRRKQQECLPDADPLEGIEQLRDLRDEVLRQRAQMRQSYMAALNQANLSANYAGLLRERDRDARDAAGAAARNQ
jgi:conjugative transfer pilus assembly protein TraH